MERLTRWVLRHRLIVVVFWVLSLGGGMASAAGITDVLSQEFAVPDKPAFAANEAIVADYGNGGEMPPVVLVTTVPEGAKISDAATTAELQGVLDSVLKSAPNLRVIGYPDTLDPRFISEDGRTTFAYVYGPAAGGFSAAPVALPAIEAAVADATVAGAPIALTGIPMLTGSRAHSAAAHVLLYCVDAAGPLFATVDREFGADVDHWIYIADPRYAEAAPKGRATICTWPLGSFPYATELLDPKDILIALERAVAKVAKTLKDKRVGLAIMDCSAVMRYVQNAADEVDFEREWHSGVHRIWHQHLQSEPAVDVCGYRHADVEALGLTIDQLGTALTLISNHDRAVVVETDAAVVSGRAAIRRILAEARPAGVSAAAWREITRAAADSLAGA